MELGMVVEEVDKGKDKVKVGKDLGARRGPSGLEEKVRGVREMKNDAWSALTKWR